MTGIIETLAVSAFGAGAAGTGAALGTIASVVGTGLSVISAFGSGDAAQDAAAYNARLLEQRAYSAEQEGQQEAGRLYDINRRKRASATAAFGASGADVNLGSPVDVMADLAGQAALDEEIARWRGRKQATAFRNDAAAKRWEGEQAASAAQARAGTMLLTGFGRISGGFGGGATSYNPGTGYD